MPCNGPDDLFAIAHEKAERDGDQVDDTCCCESARTEHGACTRCGQAPRAPLFMSCGEQRKRDEEAAQVKADLEEMKGREALTRLGIFLEKHTVHEDTVDSLSSMGWL